METLSDTGSHLSSAGRRVARRLFLIAENRLNLFMVEAEEERGRILLAVWLAVGAAAFGLLAGVALTILIAVALWEHSPIIALLVLTALYTTVAVLFWIQLLHLKRNWRTLPGTLDQLKKDRECLDKTLT